MTRTQKTGIEYFPVSVDFFDNPKICAVTVEHGIKGQAAAMMILCAIYRNGYFIEYLEKHGKRERYSIDKVKDSFETWQCTGKVP